MSINKIDLNNNSQKTLLLFDVDNTLTLPREKITNEMKNILQQCKDRDYEIATVGGGTIDHIKDQVQDYISKFDYVFTENGTKSYKNNELFFQEPIKDIIGEKALNEIINFSLKYMSEIDLPFKRGTFFELRTGLANICPMGRNCTYEERLKFIEYDNKHGVLKDFKNELDRLFSKKYNLVFSLGSSVSIDMFVEGYRKPFCLQFIHNNERDIYFFGDKTSPGGNDYEISIDNRIKQSFTVTSPEDTIEILKKEFLK